jgi:exonuclease III
MSRRFTPKIVTANDLREGDVVYLTADGRWSRFHHEAELIEDEAHAQQRLLHATAQKLIVVGVYLADAQSGPNGPEPTHFREEFRTRGPSNYNHGKQADLAQ